VVCWSSFGQDGNSYGVFGKYYLGDPINQPLNFFSLRLPALDAILGATTIGFEWQQTNQAHLNFPWEIEYTLYLDISEEFNDPQRYTGIYDTVYSVNDLMPGQTYFWKVLAINIEGDSLWSSETFGFYIDPAASIEALNVQRPDSYELYQNYPNPFNPTTTIIYELPITNYVELSIFNYLGQKVVTLVSSRQNAGYHQMEWDATGFASGIYVVTLEAGNFKASQKMLLVK
jgi:hypothetical protein